VQDTKNDTWLQYMHPLIPITALPCLFLAIQAALLYSTVEFLCAASVVVAVKYILNSPPDDRTPFIPCITAVAALGMFFYAIFQDTDEQSTSAYTLEQEDDDEEQTAVMTEEL
jgi:hypothetical protein